MTHYQLHQGCGGELRFSHEMPDREVYKCQKCGELVIFPKQVTVMDQEIEDWNLFMMGL